MDDKKTNVRYIRGRSNALVIISLLICTICTVPSIHHFAVDLGVGCRRARQRCVVRSLIEAFAVLYQAVDANER